MKKKKLNRVLKLSKETLRTLTGPALRDVHGGQTGTICSGVTDTCETCRHCPTDFYTCEC